MLRSLRLLGLEAVAEAFYQRLDALYSSRRFPIDDEAYRYWTEAIGSLK